MSFSNIKRKLSNVHALHQDNDNSSSSPPSPRLPSPPKVSSPTSPRSSKRKQSILDLTPQWIKDIQRIKPVRGTNEPLYPEFSEISFSPSVRKSQLIGTDNLKDIHELISSFDAVMVGNGEDETYSSEEEDGDDMEFGTSLTYGTTTNTSTAFCFTDEAIQMMAEDQERTLNDKLFELCVIPEDRGLDAIERLTGHIGIHVDSFRGPNNITLMHAAARANNVHCLSFFLQSGGNMNALDSMQSTPLHHACSSGAKDAVMFLVVNKANVNAKDQYECFPLLLAMRNNYKSVMRILLEYGKADVHLKSKLGETCLHIAAREGYLKRTKFLVLDCHASINRTNTNSEHVLFVALKNRSITQLICDQVDSFKNLCKLVSVTNRYGKTVFHEACENGYLEGLLVLIQEIKKKGVAETSDPKVAEAFLWERLNEYDGKKGYAPLHFAVINGHLKLVKYLALSAQVDIDKRDLVLKNTALHYAIQEKHNEICDILTQFGKASLSSKNAKRESCKRLSLKMGVTLHPSEEELNKKRRRLSLGLVLIR